MAGPLKSALQLILYLAFAVAIGYLSTSPPYRYADAELAVVKVSISHATQRVEPCRQLTQEEIEQMAANMRRSTLCGRERLPLVVSMMLNGESVLERKVSPAGLWGDGPATVYERFSVEPGVHDVTIRLRDSARTEGWDYQRSDQVNLKPGRYFTVRFRPEAEGFEFR